MSRPTFLSGESLTCAARPWLEALGASDQRRLNALLELASSASDNGKISLAACLQRLFPEDDNIKALANLTRLRMRLNDASDGDPASGKPDLGLRFHVDTRKKSPPSERVVWFTGPDEGVRLLSEFTELATADIAGLPLVKLGANLNQEAGQVLISDRSDSRSEGEAVELLEHWTRLAEGPRVLLLTAESGMGKTTTLKTFARHLQKRRQQGSAEVPQPIYISLGKGRMMSNKQPCSLEDWLGSIIRHSGLGVDAESLTPHFLRLLREDGALIILDGLEDLIPQAHWGGGAALFHQLRSCLSNAVFPGKIIVSCRTSYFRETWDQRSFLGGGYSVVVLRPFTAEQILNYLQIKFSGDADGGRNFGLFTSIQGLMELGASPAVLSVIIGQISELEELHQRGEPIHTDRLYELIIRSWFERDDGRHVMAPPHKRRLMEALAAAAWSNDRKTWDVDRLEDWFDEYLLRNPAMTAAYSDQPRTLLKQDLRMATLLVRSAEGSGFVFAHASLHEYCLASHLARALASGDSSAWDMPMPGEAVIDFLGKILQNTATPEMIQCLEVNLANRTPRVALNVFRYWLRAVEKGWPEPKPKQIHLEGADLTGWTIAGHSSERPLNLRGAFLQGLRLNRARLQFVDVSDADATRLEARQALFLQVDAARARMSGADLAGLQWREGSLEAVESTGVSWDGCELIHVNQTGAGLAGQRTRPNLEYCLAAVFTGHSAEVCRCTWNRTETAFLTGSVDGVVCVWDAVTGRELFKLQSHPGTDPAWSSDVFAYLAREGIGDGTREFWNAAGDAMNGAPLPLSTPITTHAWTRDKKQLLVAMGAGQLQVLDALTGLPHLVMVSGIGHRTEILPDGESRHFLPEDQFCVISGDRKRIVRATTEAWRWLGWIERDFKGRFLSRLHAEVFGPLAAET